MKIPSPLLLACACLVQVSSWQIAVPQGPDLCAITCYIYHISKTYSSYLGMGKCYFKTHWDRDNVVAILQTISYTGLRSKTLGVQKH